MGKYACERHVSVYLGLVMVVCGCVLFARANVGDNALSVLPKFARATEC